MEEKTGIIFPDGTFYRSPVLRIKPRSIENASDRETINPPGMRYFQLRNRLKNAIEMVVELSAENGMASERITEVGTLPAAFDDPFLFVVVVEAGAGKSALLNALFGGGSDRRNSSPGPGVSSSFNTRQRQRSPTAPGTSSRFSDRFPSSRTFIYSICRGQWRSVRPTTTSRNNFCRGLN